MTETASARSILPPEGEHLTTGWEPDTPEQDTLVRRAVLAHASWTVEVARHRGKPWHSGEEWAAGHIGDRGLLTNAVVLLRPPTDLAVIVAEVNEFYGQQVPYLLLSAWPTPDLTAHGLTLLGHPPLMVRWPGTQPDGRAVAAGVEVREVSGTAELETAERVLVEGYPLPDLQPLTPGDLYDPSLLDGPTRVFIAWDGETPVATSVSHTPADLTLVEYVAALPQARGRGAGAAVAWAATTAEPDLPAVLIASDDGRPVYERMGYVAIERWTAWARPGTGG